MKLSKKRYTYGKSYSGRNVFRHDNTNNISIAIWVNIDYEPNEVEDILFNNTAHNNTYLEETAVRISKQEFIDIINLGKAKLNKIK